jgi:high affinity sulfate transporter 1
MGRLADMSKGLLADEEHREVFTPHTPTEGPPGAPKSWVRAANDPLVPNKLRSVQSRTKQWAQARLPILTWLPSYSISKSLQGDAVGGITIGMVALAQTLAHASIATTNSIQGPYTAFIPTLTYAFFGTSPHTSVSSGAIAAILIADQLRPWTDIQDRTELASLLALISGLVLIMMGWLKAAFAVRFLSQSTLSGFISAGAILIMVQQGRNFLGYVDFPQTEGFWEHVKVMIEWLPRTDPGSAAMGTAGLLILHQFGKLKKRADEMIKKGGPSAGRWGQIKRLTEMKEIIVALLGILLSFFSTFLTEDGNPALTIVGHIPAGVPPFRAPWTTKPVEELLESSHRKFHFVFGGVLVALTSFLTTYATTKKMALKFGYQLDASQELIALGSAGVMGSFFGAFPPSGSLSRTGLAAELGVKTQMGGVFAAGVIGLGLMFLAPAVSFLPKAALASIIMKSSVNLLDFDYPREIWNGYWKPKRKGGLKRDLRIWVIAFATTLLLGVLYGIGLAVLVDILLIVRDASQPNAVVLGRVDAGGGRKWHPVDDWPDAVVFEGIMVFEFRGPLSFASAEWFQEAVEKHRLAYNTEYKGGVKIIVLSFTSVHYLDKTALIMLKDLVAEWSKNGVECVISGAKHQVRALVEKVLVKHVKQTNFMVGISDAVEIARARLAAHQEHNRGNRGLGDVRTSSEADCAAACRQQQQQSRRKSADGLPRRVSAPESLNEAGKEASTRSPPTKKIINVRHVDSELSPDAERPTDSAYYRTNSDF